MQSYSSGVPKEKKNIAGKEQNGSPLTFDGTGGGNNWKDVT